MSEDDDLAAAIPDPPPPAPNAREAAIRDAMRRFDGEPGPPARAETRPTSSGSWIRRPQVGALVTAGLIALVGLPAAWMVASRQNETYRQASHPSRFSVSPASSHADSRVARAVPSVATAPTTVAAVPHDSAPPAPVPPPRETSAPPVAETVQAPRVTPPELAKMEPLAPEAAIRAAARLQGRSNLAAASPPPPPPPPPMAMAAPSPPAPVAPIAPAPAMDSNEVVVTSARMSRSRVGRGDWNACTIDDPNRNLSLCRRTIDPAAPGAKGVAAAHLADGLAAAWRGDAGGAIAAFDQAIAIAPTLPAAYINRSLAYARSGDDDRALADADKAVRYAPNNAQARYNRSQLLRRKGEIARAEADEQRAADIDPSYNTVIPR